MIDQTLSHYRIISTLGKGGMGEVYLARDTELERQVAIKILPPAVADDPQRLERFQREAKAVARINHPSVVTLHSVEEHQGIRFIVMEHIEGSTLEQLIEPDGMPIDRFLAVAGPVVEALKAAHDQGVIHRDLKPANIMVTDDGLVKVLDFGLARLQNDADVAEADAATELMTRPGMVMGTTPYMSPEQASGHPVDHRSDIFSLGIVLYQMVAGDRPFHGTTSPEMISSILKDPPPPLGECRADLPPGLVDTIHRCLEKDPDQRFQSAAELSEQLASVDREPAPARRRWWLPALAGIALLGAGAWLATTRTGTPGSDPATPQRPGSAEITHAAIRKDWILLAHFEGTVKDSMVLEVARDVILAGLEQSGLVAPLPSREVRRLLEMAGKSPQIPVTGDLAREIAARSNARTYVEGRVDQIASSYRIALRLMDAENNRAIATVQRTAQDDEALILTLDLASRELREALGENTESLTSTDWGQRVHTDSFEAYRLYKMGMKERDRELRIRYYREALAHDPRFARAYHKIGWALNDWTTHTASDSAMHYWGRALEYPDRLTDGQRAAIEGDIEWFYRGDYRAALTAYDRAVVHEPLFLRNRGVLLQGLGRFDEAVESYRTHTRLFDPSGTRISSNEIRALIAAGRADEARARMAGNPDRDYATAETFLLMASDDWPAIEQGLAARREGDELSAYMERTVEATEIALSVSRGEFQAALGQYLEHEKLDISDPWEANAWAYRRFIVQALVGISEEFEFTPVPEDSIIAHTILRGWVAAARGRPTVARANLEAIPDWPEREQLLFEVTIETLEGWVALAEHRWDDALAALRRANEEGMAGDDLLSRWVCRWLIGQTYEAMGRPREAAQAYESVTSPVGISWFYYRERPLFVSFAHERLVHLYAELGEHDRMLEHWAVLRERWRSPEAPLDARLAEAARLAGSE